MKEITEQHAAIDRYVDRAFRENPAMKPCCRPGCFACCSEAVYAGEAEVLHIIESLTLEQIAEVKVRLHEWLEKTAPLMKQNMPDAIAYRQLHAPCVFLKAGLCSVYARRPMGCRVWFALKNPDHCELPFREHQQYANFSPEIFYHIGHLVFVDGLHVMDHLGILLAEKLLGLKISSGSRTTDKIENMPAYAESNSTH
jgi:Fe-S-cluster containining protein